MADIASNLSVQSGQVLDKRTESKLLDQVIGEKKPREKSEQRRVSSSDTPDFLNSPEYRRECEAANERIRKMHEEAQQRRREAQFQLIQESSVTKHLSPDEVIDLTKRKLANYKLFHRLLTNIDDALRRGRDIKPLMARMEKLCKQEDFDFTFYTRFTDTSPLVMAVKFASHEPEFVKGKAIAKRLKLGSECDMDFAKWCHKRKMPSKLIDSLTREYTAILERDSSLEVLPFRSEAYAIAKQEVALTILKYAAEREQNFSNPFPEGIAFHDMERGLVKSSPEYTHSLLAIGKCRNLAIADFLIEQGSSLLSHLLANKPSLSIDMSKLLFRLILLQKYYKEFKNSAGSTQAQFRPSESFISDLKQCLASIDLEERFDLDMRPTPTMDIVSYLVSNALNFPEDLLIDLLRVVKSKGYDLSSSRLLSVGTRQNLLSTLLLNSNLYQSPRFKLIQFLFDNGVDPKQGDHKQFSAAGKAFEMTNQKLTGKFARNPEIVTMVQRQRQIGQRVLEIFNRRTRVDY